MPKLTDWSRKGIKVAEENLRSESSNEDSGAETAAKPSGTAPALTELDKNMVDDLIQPRFVESIGKVPGNPKAIEAALLLKELYDKLPAEDQTLLELVFEEYSGAEIAAILAVEPATARKRVSRLMKKLASLSGKAAEILKEAELSYERITKDQKEIEQLKTETRAMLAELRAA